jgi:hypothetical protein
LAQAIAATFQQRRMPLPTEFPLPAPFFNEEARAERWRTYLEKNELSGGLRDFAAVGEALHEFIEPIYSALLAGAEFPGSWEPGGPWQ